MKLPALPSTPLPTYPVTEEQETALFLNVEGAIETLDAILADPAQRVERIQSWLLHSIATLASASDDLSHEAIDGILLWTRQCKLMHAALTRFRQLPGKEYLALQNTIQKTPRLSLCLSNLQILGHAI